MKGSVYDSDMDMQLQNAIEERYSVAMIIKAIVTMKIMND